MDVMLVHEIDVRNGHSTGEPKHSILVSPGLKQFDVARRLVMPVGDGRNNLLTNKLVAIVLVVLGFLLAASGYRADSTGYMAAGIVLLALGIVLLALKVVRRNP